ncbi:MAG: TlpA disulfide reductase family protein [Thermodesulfobacteriota bacterium]
MKNRIWRPFSHGVLLLIFACFLAGPAYGATQMPSFSLADVVTGKKVDSSTFAGKTLLVTFFATWCPPCMQEVPTLIQLQNELADKGFSVVGLSVDKGGKGVVKKLVEQRSINYPILMADDSLPSKFGGVYGIPTSFLINSKGNVVKKYPGYVPHIILENDIKKIMN